MHYLTRENSYRSPQRKISWFARKFPTLVYYRRMLQLVLWGAQIARKGEFDVENRVWGSIEIVKALEAVGVRFEVENIQSFRNLDIPCVFVSNHMSTLETFVFTCIIEPYREITFVVKESLVRYPIFKNIMISRDPVVVTRSNPREDFEAVLKGGQERLQRGISMVVFPQTTRSASFDPGQFNTIGVKLARRAMVPVVPIALRTDAWGNSKRFVKDFGRIDPSKPVRIHFGDPVYIEGNGKAEHQLIVRFIQQKLTSWT